MWRYRQTSTSSRRACLPVLRPRRRPLRRLPPRHLPPRGLLVDRLRWVGRRVVDLGRGIVDTFLRDNRVLPPVLALLALFVFAWVLAGVFLGGTDEQKPVAHRSELAQAEGTTTPEGTVSAPAEQTTGTGGANGRRRGGGRGVDSDGDGLPDRKEATM